MEDGSIGLDEEHNEDGSIGLDEEDNEEYSFTTRERIDRMVILSLARRLFFVCSFESKHFRSSSAGRNGGWTRGSEVEAILL